MTDIRNNHVFYMTRAMQLARQGMGRVAPNPLVGAVLVKNDRIISDGYHKYYGGLHAEANALKDVDASDATLYCNLEPCCHTNKQTPPCAQAIVKARVKTVVIANLDPNPEVSGKGIEILEKAGIEVITGVCEEEGEELNRVFFTNMREEMPYIHLKVAQTLDGKMATKDADSKWISDEDARHEVHLLRREYDAVAVGRKTQTIDNPKLTSRLEETACPYRLIFGDINQMKHDGHVFSDRFNEKTIVLTTRDPQKEIPSITVINIATLPLEEVFRQLRTEYKIYSILVEGGPNLLTALLDKKLFHRLTVYINPIILGNGPSFYQNEDNALIQQALKFGQVKWKTLNQQAVLEINHVYRTD